MSERNIHRTYVTLGASNHSGCTRELDDFYATDPIAMRLLLEQETFSPQIWECACGEGHLSRVLMESGYDVTSTDLVSRGFGQGGWIF